MITTFKSITMSKDGLHKVKYTIEELKGDVTIKSTVTLILEDTEIMPSETLENIIKMCESIARQEYLRR